MKRLLPGLYTSLALCALLTMGNTWACSCIQQYNGGFIHADLDRLPSNARGALFQLPETNPSKLTPKSFTITTDRRQARLTARFRRPQPCRHW